MDFNHYDIANFELDDAESPNLASFKVSKPSFLSQKSKSFSIQKMSSEEVFGNAIEILTRAREMLEKVWFSLSHTYTTYLLLITH